MQRTLRISILFGFLNYSLFAAIIEPIKIDFVHNKSITGKLVKYDGKKLYLSKEKSLYIIDKALTTGIYYNGHQIDLSRLSDFKFDRVFWSNYSEHIKINSIDDFMFSPTSDHKGNSAYDAALLDNPSTYLTNEAGNALKKFSQTYYLGAAITTGGYVLLLSNDSEKTQKMGLATILIGSIISFFAPSHVNKAGDYLKELSQHNYSIPTDSSKTAK